MKTILLILIGGCLGCLVCLVFFPGTPPVVQSPVSEAELVATPVAASQALTRFRPWSELSGTSLADYVSNLRKIACPEETVSDIIFSTLIREADAALAPNLRMNISALQARGKEVVRAMNDVGVSVPASKADFFLSATQLDMAKTSLQMYPPAGRDTNAAQRRAMLIGFNPEQMIYYKSEFERYGPTIERTLAGFRPTQAEYYAMVAAMDKNTPQDLKEKLPNLLTPERYQEFLSCQNPINLGVYAFCEEDPRLSAKTDQIIALLNERTNLSTAEFREKALNLVGPELFDDLINLGTAP